MVIGVCSWMKKSLPYFLATLAVYRISGTCQGGSSALAMYSG
jgi:hypothetical protein